MKKYSGFTLVELMITLGIIAVLLLIGVPSLKTFMKSNQLIASSNELLSALHVARSEAIKINDSVTICESSNGTSCDNTGNWANGWIVFIDRDDSPAAGSGLPCSDANSDTDCLLRAHGAITDSQFDVLARNTANDNLSSYTFNARGLPRDAGGDNAQSGTFSVCSMDDADNNTLDSRTVVVSLSGRVRVSDNAAVNLCPTAP